MTPKRRLLLERKPPNSTMMRSREHCIADRMMGSSSATCHRRRHKKYSKKRMMVCVELISLAPSLGIDSEGWVLLAKDDPWRHRLRQTMSCLSGPWWHHPSSTRTSLLYNFNLAIWDVGDGRVGPISPPSSKGYRFILTITDYFSKWAEAIPLREVKTFDMIKFVKHHIIYRFGVPWWIVHDNRPQFVSQAFQRFCNKFRIQSVSSTVYYLAAMALQKLLTRLLESFSRNSSRKTNVTGTTN